MSALWSTMLSKREVRRTLIGCVLLALATVVTVVAVGRYERERSLAETALRLDEQARANADAFNRQILQWQRQVRFLSSVPPVWGLVRANGGPVDADEHTPAEQWARRLTVIFQAFAAANPELYQVRLIGMADGGRELVRVARRAGQILIVPPDQLQRKGDTEYVQRAARLAAGEVYVSELTLDREHVQVGQPPLPVLRVATPLIYQGRLFGVVVLNYYTTVLTAQLADTLQAGYRAYLLNGQGDFLLHPDAKRSFAYELGQRWRWQDEFGSELPAAAMRSYRGAAGVDGANAIHALSRPLPLDAAHAQRDLHYVVALPDQQLDQAVRRARLNVLTAMLAGAVVVGGASYLYLGQRRQAEARIRALNASLEEQVKERTARIEAYSTLQRTILAHAPYAIMASDAEGLLTLFNPAAERLLGYAAAEVLGGPPARWHEPQEIADQAAALSAQLGRHIEPGFESFVARARLGLFDEEEWTYIRKDGVRLPVMLSVSAIRGEDGALTGFLGIAYDISARRQAEDTLRAATLAADAANRAKSEFLANMSHEIRSPMNAVLGMLMLLKQTALDARQFDYTGKAEAAGRALLGILNDILDFSRVEAGKMVLDPQPFSLDRLLREVAVILSANVGERDVEVLYEVDPALPPWVVGDSMRLQQVLINLAGNAIKFTQRGEVVVTVQLLPSDADHPDVLWLGFAIRDTGIGISPEQCQRIFDGFSQAEASTARRFGGSGLGLAISQRLVQLMGGALTVESEVGKGSTFRFSVAGQVAAAPAAVGQRPGGAVDASHLKALHCLVVDDHDTARELLSNMVKSFGWQVDAVAGGAAALEAVRRRGEPGYDAVFLDWRMPDMDGRETAERLAAMLPPERMPLTLIVTAHGREILIEQGDALKARLDGFLVKPVTPSMLFDAVAEASATRAAARQALMAPADRDVGENGESGESGENKEGGGEGGEGSGSGGQGVGSGAVSAPARVRRLHGVRLLLVEDNPINQQVARELLNYEGADITVAEHGRAAIAALREAATPFDCVLMDIQMPEMDGYEATRVIRGELGMVELPIIAMTANAMVSDREAALEAGMNDHVGKPFDLDELVETIKRYDGRLKDAGDLPAV